MSASLALVALPVEAYLLQTMFNKLPYGSQGSMKPFKLHPAWQDYQFSLKLFSTGTTFSSKLHSHLINYRIFTLNQ